MADGFPWFQLLFEFWNISKSHNDECPDEVSVVKKKRFWWKPKQGLRRVGLLTFIKVRKFKYVHAYGLQHMSNTYVQTSFYSKRKIPNKSILQCSETSVVFMFTITYNAVNKIKAIFCSFNRFTAVLR